MRGLMIAAGCAAILASAAGGLTITRQAPDSTPRTMNGIAEGYVRLVLALGRHDPDYVDAYYGPPEWKQQADGEKLPLEDLAIRARSLLRAADAVPAPSSPIEELRLRYLVRQLSAVGARIRMLQGEQLTFDEESRALYDAVAPTLPEAHFQSVLDRLDKDVPGSGPLISRYEAFRSSFVIPKDRLNAVFEAAIQGCRDRTLRHLALPDTERFTLEYVGGKSWSGYNWYQGDFRSLIQLNTDLPIYIDRALDLACHEGYPGHHVYNVLLEKHLVRDRGWIEFTVFALFSPHALIAEGTANYGIEVAFPGPDRVTFEKTVLFPAAGIDPARADQYFRVQALVEQLAYAGNEAARRYLNGEIDRAAAAAWLERFALMPRERAAQRVRFFDQYRSYVINYNLGKDLVRQFIESRPGVEGNAARRWQEFHSLLASPRLPSTLK